MATEREQQAKALGAAKMAGAERAWEGYPAAYVEVLAAAEAGLCERLCDGGMAYEMDAALRDFRRAACAAVHALAAGGTAVAAYRAAHGEDYLTRRLEREADVLVANAEARRDTARHVATDHLRATLEAEERGRRQAARFGMG